MKSPVLIFGGDGYIGWPLALRLAWKSGRDVVIADNLVTRRLVSSVGSDSLVPILSPDARVAAYERVSGKSNITFVETDARDPRQVDYLISKYMPDTIVHLAQQRSAPFSMMDQEHALYTQVNNVVTNMNILFSMARRVPKAPLLKMGSMGEYGTPNIEITEGPMDMIRNGRRHKAMFPRAGQSWYHLSKIFDTYNVMMSNRINGLTATDVMQGVVYGSLTDETIEPPLATRFDFDSIWGTVINKYVVQAVVLNKLLIYGKGGQTRGFLSLHDSIDCLSLLIDNPPQEGEYRTVNQLDEIYDTLTLASKVITIAKEFGISAETERVSNPRTENEDHFYKVEHKVLPALGFKRAKGIDEVIKEIFETVIQNRRRAVKMKSLLAPSVTWAGKKGITSDLFPLPRDIAEWSPWQEVGEFARDRSSSDLR